MARILEVRVYPRGQHFTVAVRAKTEFGVTRLTETGSEVEEVTRQLVTTIEKREAVLKRDAIESGYEPPEWLKGLGGELE
jgi:hypothetical protein